MGAMVMDYRVKDAVSLAANKRGDIIQGLWSWMAETVWKLSK